MFVLDTGSCAPEDRETLLIQQQQLWDGKRPAQMFPLGTPELDLLPGYCRHENFRGVFHYNPVVLSASEIDFYSFQGRENEILNLGPYSKVEIFDRINAGEHPVFVVEYTPNGVEVRAAFGTDKTCKEQFDYFVQTKEPENSVIVGGPPPRVTQFLKGH